MAQTLPCRYREAFNKEESQQFKEYKHSSDPNPTGGQWQIVLKLVGARRKGRFDSAFAYEAKNRQAEVVFWRVKSCVASSAVGALHEALVEASIQARTLGFQQVLVLSNCRKLVLLFNGCAKRNWRERTMMENLSYIQQASVVFKLTFVPKVVLENVYHLASQTTNVPTHVCWPHMSPVVT
ncbi:hypothetical protein SO802_002388 [Lithocarpus litseifolius]|uniref:RNase H type-1 domain-containing protein n=1 Tax=Lithocarpus litseifolius TaxID=425828 RepID=A0AAW2DYS1_9ROSI